MRKFVIIFVGLLVSLSLPVVAQMESPLTNFGLYGGNIYFANANGDGTARWAEARVLFGRGNDYRLLSFGAFVNYNEVGSKFNNFNYFDKEWAGGLAVNFGSQYWLTNYELWGWLNVGLKKTADHGAIDKYESRQNDNLFYSFGGIMFKNALNRGPFFIEKFMFTFQQPLKSSREAYWDAKPTSDSSVNKGYFKVVGENTFCSLPITRSESLRFEPKLIGSATYQFLDQRMIYSLGIGVTLARQYSQEIMTIDANIKFDQKAPGNIYSVGILVNFVELGKAVFNK